MEGDLVTEIYAIWTNAGYEDVDALRRLFLLRGNSDSAMPIFLEMALSLGGVATALYNAWQVRAYTSCLAE